MKLFRMIFVLLFFGLLLPFSLSTTVAEDVKTPRVKIEFRLAQDLPGKGLTKVTLPGSGRGQKGEVIYLYPKVELTNRDIQFAAKQKTEWGTWAITLRFTDAGGEKMYKLTKANSPMPDPNPEPLDISEPAQPEQAKEVNPEEVKQQKSLQKRLAILVNGKLIMAPVIRTTISTHCQISGSFTENEVARVVNALNKQRGQLNVILILVDDMGWTGVGCYGSDLHQTPNIDRLAKQSMKFTNAYAASPVCSPTRASIMTGISPAKLHMTIWHESAAHPPQNRKVIPPVTEGSLALDYTTLADVLHQAGYYTAHLGKWHLGTAGYYPENQGFDVNIGGTFWGCPSTFFFPYKGPFGSQKEMRYVPHLEGGSEGEYLTDRLTTEALKIMKAQAGNTLFLNMCYYTVHTPIEGKPDLVKKYDGLVDPKADHHNANYAAMTETLDENVGRILKQIDELGMTDNTVVIFTSDNGGYINGYREMDHVTGNAPLRSGKGSLYEGGVRVPLLIKWPGVTKPGAVSDEPVTTCDFYPTLLEILGLPGDSTHNAKVEGMSLVPLLQETAMRLKRDSVYFHYPHYYPTTTPVSSVRSRDWKLLEYYEDGRLELYNLADDLNESKNLAKQNPEKTAELQEDLHRWLNKNDAQIPVANLNRKR